MGVGLFFANQLIGVKLNNALFHFVMIANKNIQKRLAYELLSHRIIVKHKPCFRIIDSVVYHLIMWKIKISTNNLYFALGWVISLQVIPKVFGQQKK
jgi:hypothetical protein